MICPVLGFREENRTFVKVEREKVDFFLSDILSFSFAIHSAESRSTTALITYGY
jgi:hypothetical protein